MKIILTIVITALLGLSARADEKEKAAPAKTGWASFFKNLKSTLSQSAVSGERKKAHGATSVAAVRGKEQKDMADPNEPTLKGDARSAKVKKEMIFDAKFEASVDLVSKGRPQDGRVTMVCQLDRPFHHSS